jgi:hypothetical protein
LQDFNNILQLNEIMRRAAQGDLESVEKLIEEHFQEKEGIPFAMSQGPVMRGKKANFPGTCERERLLLEAKAWALGKLQRMQGRNLDGGMDLPQVMRPDSEEIEYEQQRLSIMTAEDVNRPALGRCGYGWGTRATPEKRPASCCGGCGVNDQSRV